ncbi:PREDICTED: uncharacterized protein LOC107186766 [Dufourea novaeangliae]|uniref:THAP-type domain-containing protein n=1 Tax=Dufourea novaeangliae TaxID=178035 RepID=A0A154P9S7_DUFNO|nr:PREDICTED: uncharacterized protein LOC107186766 [Dufourea novaeangliae]KZC08602.1 hypothetical protein WN55_11257 [Dufourea novaeangliae]
MPHPCVVCGRSRMNPNNREEEYMFFGFPVNDETRCRKWLEFCCREDLYKLTKKQLLQRMVCSKHFEQKDFLNEYFDRLNSTAVPSTYDPKQSLYNITCVLCRRSRRDPPDLDYDGATFHHFPGEEFRCLKWLDFVGVDSYYRLTRKEILFCYICSKHFDPSQFMPGYKSRLVDNAVPNIRNPDQLDGSEQCIMESISEPKSYNSSEKPKKLDPLPPAVLESQACAACSRSRSDPRNKLERYKFHPFPAYEIGRCLRWCQFLGREDLLKMSPNQIRKLVLCSKHFQTGQSFHKVGPCDAVPTIKDVSQLESVGSTEQIEDEQDNTIDESSSPNTTKGTKKQGFSRPLVSSKKPKVDNKPTPLAKKRGKSKRPTLINIPRPDPNNIENRMTRKLPLPPNSNWKIQFTDQLQPIAIANNVTSNVTNSGVQGNIKKVILPFTGDISNLGAPIPVHSLSSIPPGLLIKINLPEQEQQKSVKVNKRQTRSKSTHTSTTSNEIDTSQEVWLTNGETTVTLPVMKQTKEDTDRNLVEFLSISPEETEVKLIPEALEVHEEVVLPHSLEVLDEEAANVNEDQFYEDFEEVECLSQKEEKPVRRKKVSGTMRRTIFPIRSEVSYFLRKLAPYMHRLPRKGRAQVKLAIVNMVIDRL